MYKIVTPPLQINIVAFYDKLKGSFIRQVVTWTKAFNRTASFQNFSNDTCCLSGPFFSDPIIEYVNENHSLRTRIEQIMT